MSKIVDEIKDESDNRIEEKYKELSEYHKNLDIISNEKLVDLLKDESVRSQISFHTWNDVIEEKDYYCVIVFQRNTKDVMKEYLAENQDPIDIYNNLIYLIENKKVKSSFNILDLVRYPQIVCSSGDNTIIFPKEVVKPALESNSTKKENGVYCCIYGSREVFLPKSLPKKNNKKMTYNM